MRKCKNLVSGEVCDFFVYDVDVIPDWFVGYGVIGFGYYVNDNCGGIRMFNTSDQFASFYEDVSELKDISTYIGVESPPNQYVDASFIGDTLDHPVGRKCRNIDSGKEYNFFIYGKDKNPDWFDISKVDVGDRHALIGSENMYIINSTYKSGVPDIFKQYYIYYETGFNNYYKELKDAHSEYVNIKKNDGSACPVGDCGDKKSAAARFCRCRNDHSVVHEYFIYGTDVTPEWFKKIYIGCIGGYNFVTHNYILRRKSDGKISIITNEDFNKNLEVVDKLVLTDMYGKKNENYIGKISEEEMESVSVNYLCTDDGYTVKIDAAKYATDRMINSVTNDTSKRPEKIVVNDGVAAGTKVHTDNLQEGLDEYVKKSDVSDIDRAEQWFNNLHPEVFKYIMLRDLNIDEMLRIYKKEISNL